MGESKQGSWEEFLGPKKERHGPLWLFIVIIFLFLIGMGLYTPSYSSIEQHNVLQDLDGLVMAVNSFMVGDLVGFFDNLLDGIVVVAIFMVLYSITHFLFTTVFKKLFSKKQATVMAFVMSVYALINNKIYNYLISMNALAIALLVFMALIFMIWGLGKKGVSDYKEMNVLLKKAKQGKQLSKDEYLKVKQAYNEMRNEKK